MCHSQGCHRASVVMARRCIQQTCILKGAPQKEDLCNQISDLAKRGIITSDIKDWATAVRWVGNDAAHPNAEVVTMDDAEDCLHLAEQMLHVLFVTPAIAEALRKAKRK